MKINKPIIKCKNCGSPLTKVNHETDMEYLTEGQLADRIASGLSSSFAKPSVTIARYICPKCEAILEIIG